MQKTVGTLIYAPSDSATEPVVSAFPYFLCGGDSDPIDTDGKVADPRVISHGEASRLSKTDQHVSLIFNETDRIRLYRLMIMVQCQW